MKNDPVQWCFASAPECKDFSLSLSCANKTHSEHISAAHTEFM
jgi:hypothetical protein